MEELKKLNQPPEPDALSTPLPCPLAEQWENLLAILDDQRRLLAAQNRLLELILKKPIVYATKDQASEMTRQLSMIRASIEQAGRRNERRRFLPKLRLPPLTTATFKGISFTLVSLAVLAILLYASVTIWNNLLKPLLRLVP